MGYTSHGAADGMLKFQKFQLWHKPRLVSQCKFWSLDQTPSFPVSLASQIYPPQLKWIKFDLSKAISCQILVKFRTFGTISAKINFIINQYDPNLLSMCSCKCTHQNSWLSQGKTQDKHNFAFWSLYGILFLQYGIWWLSLTLNQHQNFS